MRKKTRTIIDSYWSIMTAGILVFSITLPAAAADKVRVTGTLFASAFVDDVSIMEIELAAASVSLVPIGAAAPIDEAKTALDGRFLLQAEPNASYQICWSYQGESGCATRIKVGKSPVWVERVRARFNKKAYVYGKVLTGDARPCWVQDSFFGLDVSTEIRGGGQTARANTHGEYILLPAGSTFRLTARCETAEVGQTVTLAGQRQRVDMVFANHAPQITSVAATDGNNFITRAIMDDSLKVIATDRDLDGDLVEYRWQLPEGNVGSLSGSTINTEQWRLPNSNGRRSIYIMARDGRGGFALKRFDMQVGVNIIDVSGRAVDEVTGKPIRGATVRLGDSKTRTDRNGWFTLSTKPIKGDRYVLNISHRNFALVSRILDRSSYGQTYQMIRTQVTTFPSDNDVELEDNRSSGACGSLPNGNNKLVPRLAPARIYREDRIGKDGKDADLGQLKEMEVAVRSVIRKQQDCERRGIMLRIPANSFVRQDGSQFSGTVRASIATLNPARRTLPGDYRAIDANGDQVEMLSFGALYADFTDMRGNRLELRSGAVAEIMTPISSYQSSAAGSTIQQWTYNEETGFWQEEGKGKLRQTADGPRYVGTTEHFSTINMDVAGNDPAVATCVRVEVGSDFGAWTDLVLRAYVSYGGDSVQVKETALDNSQYHAIYRIPYGSAFPPNTLRLELRGTSAGQEVVLLDNIINTDARPKMTGNNLWPPYPYTECGDPILLTADPGVVPPYGDFDAFGRPSFLIGPYGQFNPADGAQQAQDYYNALDPAGDKDTLGKWWSENGFGADGLGNGNLTYINQAYLNFNDLGFGRDMHCLENGNDFACYVTNYGLPDQNLGNADAAENKDAAQRGATVAMEYDASAPVDERVQFYVFGGGDAAAPRITFADLDGLGPKPVPFLCAVCHGGSPNLNANGTVDYARFREFDLPSFKYSGGRDWDYGSANLDATELGNFAALNEMVRNTTNGLPIGDLIDAWYPGGFAGSPAPAVPIPPAGWATEPTGYHEVHGKTCRTCHIARDEGNPNSFFVLNSLANFQGTSYTVCGSGVPKRRFMPNAVVTYKNFWADTSRVLMYETLTNQAAGSCDDN